MVEDEREREQVRLRQLLKEGAWFGETIPDWFFSLRIRRALAKNEIFRVGELLRKTAKELREIPGIGTASVRTIEALVEDIVEFPLGLPIKSAWVPDTQAGLEKLP